MLQDGHVDLPILLRALYHNQIDNDNVKQAFENGTFPGHVDIRRLQEGLSGGAFWSLFAPCPADGSDISDENLAASKSFQLLCMDTVVPLPKHANIQAKACSSHWIKSTS